MQTLVDKVITIEEEARDRLAEAEAAGRQELDRVRSSEENVLTEIQTRAKKRAQDIVRERVQQARSELHLLGQEEKKSLETIARLAAKNQASARALLRQLFTAEYMRTGPRP